MKAAAGIIRTHNPFEEARRASCLRENFTSSSYGEGLETGRALAQAPRQSLTRQLFFRWIKKNLRIKAFYGTSVNAVKTQIWIAIAIYVLVAIVKKRMALDLPHYNFLHNSRTRYPLKNLVTNCVYSTYNRTAVIFRYN